ncbi:response regulator FixJ [Candidatus Viadribacter manganicus]|uniref:Two-component system response regulator n=1 Tax=Candidatus Viadribacter manganicus TaxID=1759059 RepID=A0A1B1AJP4_9PROT|nr:response regulator FixJ [Candidatus Viadribacter manganicus]ANP46775.1 two-component system response regulator [Candidatus Viadribacter manganicus]
MSGPVVHIVDDDAPLRDSIAFLLNAEDLETRTYEGAGLLLGRSGELEPGCIITDIRMPEMNGLEMVQELKRKGVLHPIIVLTGHGDVSLAVQAMKAGVIDFLEKPFEDEALLRAVRTALSESGNEASRHKELALISERTEQLTAREKDVFKAIVAGDSNKAAALRLGISPRTVEIYRANVMTKMHANSLSELVRMALLIERS